jgi:hypothetical protein
MQTPRSAAPDEAGRNCPFCRFALKPGTAVVDCHRCSATHHSECWHENGGCAIVGCAGAPGRAAQSAAPAQAAVPLPNSMAPPPAFPPPRVPGATNRTNRPLVAAIAVLTLAIAGSAAAVVIGTGGSDSGARSASATPRPTVATSVAATSSSPAQPSAAVDRPASDRERIQETLVRYYSRVGRGDLRGAWRLLSPSYKTWKASNGGYGKWAMQERVNQAHLDATGLHVTVRNIDRDGIATIFVTGMHFSSPTSAACPYEGITWARRTTSGGWLYDQGYLQSATRSAMWRSRRNETLGYACESTGY